MVNSNVTTIELDGNETAVKFSTSYPFYWITNKGSSDIYVSLYAGIVPKADGVYTIEVGSSERIGNGSHANGFYILGSGEVYIRGEEIAAQPSFRRGGKGGENSGVIAAGYEALLTEIGGTFAADKIFEF